jgi:hypothetical protein
MTASILPVRVTCSGSKGAKRDGRQPLGHAPLKYDVPLQQKACRQQPLPFRSSRVPRSEFHRLETSSVSVASKIAPRSDGIIP